LRLTWRSLAASCKGTVMSRNTVMPARSRLQNVMVRRPELALLRTPHAWGRNIPDVSGCATPTMSKRRISGPGSVGSQPDFPGALDCSPGQLRATERRRTRLIYGSHSGTHRLGVPMATQSLRRMLGVLDNHRHGRCNPGWGMRAQR